MLGGPFKEAESEETVYHSSLLKCEGEKKLPRLIHITKCAGTTLENVSKKSWGKYDRDYNAAVSSVYTRDGASWHVPLMYAKSHVLRDLLKAFDYFVVVRNPYDRVVSEFFCPWGGAGKQRNVTVSGFNEWIGKRLRMIKAQMSDESPGSVLHGHWTPQHMYVVDSNGKLIVRKENVIPLEDLASQYAQLVERYHLPEEYQLSNTESLNVGKSKLFCPADLNSSNIALILEVYSEDFEYFGYSRDLPAAQREGAHNQTSRNDSAASSDQSFSSMSAKQGPIPAAIKGTNDEGSRKRRLDAVHGASFEQLLSLLKKKK